MEKSYYYCFILSEYCTAIYFFLNSGIFQLGSDPQPQILIIRGDVFAFESPPPFIQSQYIE